MNAFPEDYLVHNLPLILLSGLEDEDKIDASSGDKARVLLREGGFRIKTDLPAVKGDLAEELLRTLLKHDSSDRPWSGRQAVQLEAKNVFRVRSVGRTYALPPRKAPPPPHSPRIRPTGENNSPPSPLTLHSTLSPLTPSSPLYPDGLLTPLWVTKHQSRLPSVFISFFTLESDRNISTLQDNKLRSEINEIRSVFTATRYRTKFIVVLLGNGSIGNDEVEERLSIIRKATSLDVKSLYFVAAETSQIELSGFTKSLLSTLFPISVEYYRELSKHARRKRSRSTVPQPTIQPISGSSHSLSLQGWNVRYEFKLGVFAEFRQEMEAALQNYQAAYEILFSADVFEAVLSWSGRFNEARLLADVTVIRIIRCLLWLGQTTNAVRWWIEHRDRVRDIVNRRGSGTEGYGWESWQSIWSQAMADMVRRAQVMIPQDVDRTQPTQPSILVHSEKTLPSAERFRPWESLHHEGYWLNLAQKHIVARREKAESIPEEDRAPPGQSPASAIASRSHLYDTYLTLPPHQEYPIEGEPIFHYTTAIIALLDAAIVQFSDRGQILMTQLLQLKKCKEFVRASMWSEAMPILRDLWQSQAWRRSGWWDLLAEVGNPLISCASETGDIESLIQLVWELSTQSISPTTSVTSVFGQAFTRSAKDEKHVIALDSDHSVLQLNSTFVFATDEGRVGEAIDAQLSLHCLGSTDDIDFNVRQVKIVFEGSLKPIYLLPSDVQTTDNSTDSADILDVTLEDSDLKQDLKSKRVSLGAIASLSGETDLTMRHKQTKIFQLRFTPREAGDVSVASITAVVEQENYEVTLTCSSLDKPFSEWWEMKKGRPVSRLCGKMRDVTTIKILPKPPKIDIEVPQLRKTFYTNETIDLKIHAINREEEIVSGTIEARLISPSKNAAVLEWSDQGEEAITSTPEAAGFVQKLDQIHFNDLSVNAVEEYTMAISRTDEAMDHELEVLISYTLLSSPETKLTKVLTIDVPVIRPFEANFSFHARIHSEPWPDFFAPPLVQDGQIQLEGLKQQYLVSAVVASFATEEVIIDSMQLNTSKIVGAASCITSKCEVDDDTVEGTQSEASNQINIQPEQSHKSKFDMTIQKRKLGDRQPIAIDLLLEIKWRRSNAGNHNTNTSTLQVPRFLASSAEPRVLLRASRQTTHPTSQIHKLTYTIENPSLHFLTFNLAMESSDDFGFSGPKAKSISLVPISRYEATYRLLVHNTTSLRKENASNNKGTNSAVAGSWMKVRLEVVDAYFGQTLKVQAASEGVRVDKLGNVFVWVE